MTVCDCVGGGGDGGGGSVSVDGGETESSVWRVEASITHLNSDGYNKETLKAWRAHMNENT